MAVRACFFILILFQTFQSLSAQERYLLLNKPGVKHDITYHKGDPIQFCMKKEHFVRHDEITGFTDTTIVFDSYSINPKDLKFIRMERKGGIISSSSGIRLILAGLILFGADYLNYTLIRGHAYRPDKSLDIISGSLIFTGLLLAPTKYHKFRPSWKHRIEIMTD